MNKIKTFTTRNSLCHVDYHLHSNFSDGNGTIEDYVVTAKKLGLEEIALTDHFWRSSEWIDEYVEEIEKQREKHSYPIFTGVEAKVIDLEGNVDISQQDMKKVDFVMGVVHRFVPDSPQHYNLAKLAPEMAAIMEGILTKKMIANSDVDFIGHPTRTYYKFHYGKTTKNEFPWDILCDMVQCASRYGKPFEYNFRVPFKGRKRLMQLYLEYNVPFTIGSDSHDPKKLYNIDYDEVERMIATIRGGIDE